MPSPMPVELKINIIGSVGAGKTSLINQYALQNFQTEYNTLGAQLFYKTIQLENETLKLKIWDTCGQDRFQFLTPSCYKHSDGCFLIFDVTDEENFSCLEKWRTNFFSHLQSPVDDFPLIILGNKLDLKNRAISREIALSWCEERQYPYFEVSAKDNINVDMVFETLARRALIHYHEYRASSFTDSIKLTSETEEAPRRGCC